MNLIADETKKKLTRDYLPSLLLIILGGSQWKSLCIWWTSCSHPPTRGFLLSKKQSPIYVHCWIFFRKTLNTCLCVCVWEINDIFFMKIGVRKSEKRKFLYNQRRKQGGEELHSNAFFEFVLHIFWCQNFFIWKLIQNLPLQILLFLYLHIIHRKYVWCNYQIYIFRRFCVCLRN